MNRALSFYAICAVACLLVSLTSCTETDGLRDFKNRVRFRLTGSPCVRLLNTTGSIGCSTPESGIDGPLVVIDTDSRYTTFLSQQHFPDTNVVLALHPAFFNMTTLVEFLRPSVVRRANVVGILLMQAHLNEFSPASTRPNLPYTVDPSSSHEWNPQGNGLSFATFTIPIVSLSGDETERVLSTIRYKQAGPTINTDWHDHGVDNDKYPIARSSLHYNMWADSTPTTPHCLREGNCLPIGGRSVWGSPEVISSSKGKKYLVVLTQSDSSAFFHDNAFGALSAASPVATLLSVAQALHTARPDYSQSEEQVLFAFFTGEAWGFIGSQRFTEDIHGFQCDDVRSTTSGSYCRHPYRSSLVFEEISPDDISAILDLSQLSFPDASGEFQSHIVHPSDATHASGLVADFLNFVSNDQELQDAHVQASQSASGMLPPTSLNSFLLKDPTTPGFVLSSFTDEFNNDVFYSEYDTAVNSTAVCKSATLIARYIFHYIFKDVSPAVAIPDTLIADCGFVGEVLDCLAGNFSDCQLTQTYLADLQISGVTYPSFYAGVYNGGDGALSLVQSFVFRILALYTSELETPGCSGCDGPNEICISQTCYTSPVYLHESYSPAFELDQHSGLFTIVNNASSHSQWTESFWDGDIHTTVYVSDSTGVQVRDFMIGIGTLLVTALFLVFVHKQHKSFL